MPLFLIERFAKIAIGLMIIGCFGLGFSPVQNAYAEIGEDFFSSNTSRECGYPGYRFDMYKIVEAAKGYPNSEILILTGEEEREIQKEINAWNRQGKQPRIGMTPCFNCSPRYSACIVYKIFEGNVAEDVTPEPKPEPTFRPEPKPTLVPIPIPVPSIKPLPIPKSSPFPKPIPTIAPAPTSKPAPKATPTPTPSPTPTPTPPALHCSDQVEVGSFVTKARSGLISAFFVRQGLSALSLTTGLIADEGITFEARVRIREGAIPIDNIHIRYIQNISRWDGRIFIVPGPDWQTTLSCGSLPILDLVGTATPPPPFYLGLNFREDPDKGSLRRVIVTDSPNLRNIVISHPDGAQTVGIGVEAFYTMYLGCVIGDDALTFETLSTLDWCVRYKGSVIGGPPWQFRAEADAGITTGLAVKSNSTPVMQGDTFNRCQAFR